MLLEETKLEVIKKDCFCGVYVGFFLLSDLFSKILR